MKRIFICSPYRGNIRMNTARAIYYAEQVAEKGNIPIVPHLYFPIFLDENDPAERVKGIDMGLELMAVCDEVYVFGFEITEGMKFELDHAKTLKKPVRLYDLDFEPVNVRTLPVDERAGGRYRAIVKSQKLVRGGCVC